MGRTVLNGAGTIMYSYTKKEKRKCESKLIHFQIKKLGWMAISIYEESIRRIKL